MKRNFLSMAIVAISLLGLFSCSKNEIEEVDETVMANVAKQYVDHTVIPTYVQLAAATEQLVVDLQQLKASPSQAALNAACSTFLTARAWWEKSEAFLYGAASDFGIDPHIDSWPLDADGFNTMMSNSAQIAAMDGEGGDEYAGNYLGASLLGFHGIEYILFSNGQPKSVSAITNDMLIYAVAVAGDLRNRCYQLEVSWAGDAAPAAHIEKLEQLELPYTVSGSDNSYGQNMLNAGKAGSTYPSMQNVMMAILDGCATIADEVGTSKIGKPYNGEDPDYIESPYSQKSIEDFHDNIISIQNAYMGGIEGQRETSKSLHSFIASINPELDTRVMYAISNALSAIDAMPAPFVQNYSDSRNGAASDACISLDDALGEVISFLRTY